MDKKKGFLNVITAIVSRIILLIVALIVRRAVIQHLGNDVNGLNENPNPPAKLGRLEENVLGMRK